MKAFKEDSIHTRIAILETLSTQTNQTLDKLENRIDTNFVKIDSKFTENLQKIDKLHEKIENSRKENINHFRATIFSIITLVGTPIIIESMRMLLKLIN